MTEYIELTLADGTKVTVKKGAIQVLEEDSGCKINRDLHVSESYEQVKAMLRDDPRRFVLDHELDFRVRRLKMLTVVEVCKRVEDPRQFVADLMACGSEDEVSELCTRTFDR